MNFTLGFYYICTKQIRLIDWIIYWFTTTQATTNNQREAKSKALFLVTPSYVITWPPRHFCIPCDARKKDQEMADDRQEYAKHVQSSENSVHRVLRPEDHCHHMTIKSAIAHSMFQTISINTSYNPTTEYRQILGSLNAERLHFTTARRNDSNWGIAHLSGDRNPVLRAAQKVSHSLTKSALLSQLLSNTASSCIQPLTILGIMDYFQLVSTQGEWHAHVPIGLEKHFAVKKCKVQNKSGYPNRQNVQVFPSDV